MLKRIIPCLDMVNGNVVKGVRFVDIEEIGDPVVIAKGYEQQGADELVFLDIIGNAESREATCAVLKRAAETLSIPFTVGGGIRTIEDFRDMLACGASKVSVNTAAVSHPQLIAEASAAFGKARVVAAIDAKQVDGSDYVFIKGGRENTGLQLLDWAKECERLGAGEILLTSIDADGTQSGYDIPMTRAVTQAVQIPVIASGGCGGINHILDVFKETGCDAALVASLFHYGKATVSDVKLAMERNGIPCR